MTRHVFEVSADTETPVGDCFKIYFEQACALNGVPADQQRGAWLMLRDAFMAGVGVTHSAVLIEGVDDEDMADALRRRIDTLRKIAAEIRAYNDYAETYRSKPEMQN